MLYRNVFSSQVALAKLLIFTMKSVLGCLFFRKIPVLVAYKEVAYKKNRVIVEKVQKIGQKQENGLFGSFFTCDPYLIQFVITTI